MAIVTNMPANTCLTTWLGIFQSSVTHTLVRPVSPSKAGRSPQPAWAADRIPPTVSTTAINMHAVWSMSVQMTVPMPLWRVYM